MQRAIEFHKQGCYVLAHDIGWRLPETVEGKPSGIVRHDSVQGCLQRLAADPRGIHCLSVPNAAEVMNLAVVLAREDMKRNGGNQGHPVIFLIDEVVAADICKPIYLSDEMKNLVAGRRHMNVGIIWTCQSARMVHNQLIGLSTEMVLFNLTMDADFKKLEESGIPLETVQKVAALPKYEHVEHRFS